MAQIGRNMSLSTIMPERTENGSRVHFYMFNISGSLLYMLLTICIETMNKYLYIDTIFVVFDRFFPLVWQLSNQKC